MAQLIVVAFFLRHIICRGEYVGSREAAFGTLEIGASHVHGYFEVARDPPI